MPPPQSWVIPRFLSSYAAKLPIAFPTGKVAFLLAKMTDEAKSYGNVIPNF
jgi:hypothetical protein